MWTPSTRKQHIRETSRYQTDVTDEEWFGDQASPSIAEYHGPATRLADARDHQRDLLCDAIWLPVAPATERPAAVEHDLSLVCEVP